MRSVTSFALVWLALAAALPAWAADPLLPVQAALLTATGGPAADGKYVVFFKLYATPVAVDPLWQEVQPEVTVSGGRLHTFLGAVDDKGVPAALFQASAPLWLGVRVGSEPELPRVRLGPVPYAVHAQSSAALQCSGCVTADHIGAGAVTADKIAASAVGASHVQFAYAASDSKGGSASHALAADTAKSALTATKASTADEALSLQCTGCVTGNMLAAGVLSPYARLDQANAFAKEQGLQAGADFFAAEAKRLRFQNATAAPAKCEAKTAGLVYFDTGSSALVVCNGSDWTPIALATPGSQTSPAASCKEIKTKLSGATDGVYWLDLDGPGGLGPLQALCDMTTDGGGWTVLARYKFADGPNPFAGNLGKDGKTWSADVGLDKLTTGSFAHAIKKFLDAGALTDKSEFAVRSGAKLAKGTGLQWLAAPVLEGVPHHTRYGAVVLDGQAYTLTSACYDGCCGNHTYTWDPPGLTRSYSFNSGDVGGTNQPWIGWVDHGCDQDGFDTTPGWNLTNGNKGNAAQKFDGDLDFLFR